MQARYVGNTPVVFVEIAGEKIVDEDCYSSTESEEAYRIMHYELYHWYWHETEIEM